MTAPVSLAAASRVELQAVTIDGDEPGRRDVALDDVSLSVRDGEFVALIGPPGCGHGALLRAVADLQPVAAGSVRVAGVDAGAARRGHAYGYVFATPALFAWRSVVANVALPLEVAGVAAATARATALDRLARVGLAELADQRPWQLSAATQQRVAIARALVFEPPLLLFDDPFGALDALTRDALDLRLHALWRDDPRRAARSVLFATHSIAEAALLATRIVVLSARPGHIVDIVDVDLPDERAPAIRDSAAYARIVQRVRAALPRGDGVG